MTVVDQMEESRQLPVSKLRYVFGDATRLDEKDGTFGLVVEKGTFDGILEWDSKGIIGKALAAFEGGALHKVTKIMAETKRVLAPGGLFISIAVSSFSGTASVPQGLILLDQKTTAVRQKNGKVINVYTVVMKKDLDTGR